MKQCGYCGRRYKDDSLKFCLDDGSALSLDTEETVVTSRTYTTSKPEKSPDVPILGDIIQTPVQTQRWNWRYVAVLAIAVLLGAALVIAYKETRRGGENTVQTESAIPPTNTAQPSTESTPIPATTDVASEPGSTTTLTGHWRLTNQITDTSYSPYANLQLEYRILINQEGTAFTASGEKIREGRRRLPAASRTKIQLQGVVYSDRVEATFVESGRRRQSNGKFVWRVEANINRLTGTFESSAASSSGSSVAIKER